MSTNILIFLSYAIAFGIVTALAATKKNRDQFGWFLIGFFFGVFGFLAILVIEEKEEDKNDESPLYAKSSGPPKAKKCPDCAEEIKFEARICRFCGKKFSESELEATRLAASESVPNHVPFAGHRTLRCRKCYTMNYDSDFVCSACGSSLE